MSSPLRIVADTNVIVSGARQTDTPPVKIIESWRRGEIELATSELILDEIGRVFSYPGVQKLLNWTPIRTQEFLAELHEGCVIVQGTFPLQISPDPGDDKLFAVALEAEANYIVSGDKQHVLSIPEYQGIKTISPTDFWNLHSQE